MIWTQFCNFWQKVFKIEQFWREKSTFGPKIGKFKKSHQTQCVKTYYLSFGWNFNSLFSWRKRNNLCEGSWSTSILQIWLLCCKIFFSKSPPFFLLTNTQNKHPATCWMWETEGYRLRRTNVKSKLCQLIFELLYVLSLWIHNSKLCRRKL